MIDQRFEAGTKKVSASIVAKPGETVVLRVSPGKYHPDPVLFLPVGGYSDAWDVQQVTHEIAETEMQDLKRSE